MKTATITDFRNRMKERLQEIEDDKDILILTGPKKRDFVVLTLEQYNAMEETTHLMSSRTNTKRLLESIGQDRAGNVTKHKLGLENKPLQSPRKKKPKVRK